MTAAPEFLIIHETIRQSWARDAGSYLLIVATIGTGWWLGSPAMQWLGFLMLVVAALAKIQSKCRFTPQEAADKLKRDYGVIGQ